MSTTDSSFNTALGLFVITFCACFALKSSKLGRRKLSLTKPLAQASAQLEGGVKKKGTPLTGRLKVAILCSPADQAGCLTVLDEANALHERVTVVVSGSTLSNFKAKLVSNHNSNDSLDDIEGLLVASGTPTIVSDVINALPNLKWIHGLFAGLDHMQTPAFTNFPGVVTNAKSVFSSSLAEYVMFAIGYFNKSCELLQYNKSQRNWDQFQIGEMRGKTMCIIGYGDIGQACAKLAKAYGIKVIAIRRTPSKSNTDPYIDECWGNSRIIDVMGRSDFCVVAAALTNETRGMLGQAELSAAKRGQIFINIGRGALLNEPALITLANQGHFGGIALDVFCQEPLPSESPMWTLPKALLSPHNADMTPGFRHDSVRLWCKQCKTYIEDGIENLDNIVSAAQGY